MKSKKAKHRHVPNPVSVTAVSQPNAESLQNDGDFETATLSHAIAAAGHPIPTLSSKVMFWRPRYLTDSQWLQHIPFYFWLTEVLQPNTVVEPNLNSGVGYFAICQAIDKLGLDSLAHAAMGTECKQDEVIAYNHLHYREFSAVSELSESEFMQGFDDASIDLLLLKHNSSMLATDAGRAELQKKLTDSAVVIIHGFNKGEVRKLSATLRKTYPSFELSLGQGLLLLCMGKHIPERLQALINQARDVSAQRLIQNIYARLGSANEDAWQCKMYEHKVHELTAKLQEQTHNIQQIQGAKQAMADTLAKANSDIAAATVHQLELNAKLAALGEETALNQAQKLQLEQEKIQLDGELAQLRLKSDQAASDISKLQQDIDVRFDELAKLTQLLVDAEARLEVSLQDNQTLRDEVATCRAELERAKADASVSLQLHTETAARLNETLSKQQTDNSRLKDALNQAQQHASRVEADAGKQADELHRVRHELSQLKSDQSSQLAEQNRTHAQEQSKTKAELADVTIQLTNANREQTKASSELTKANSELTKTKSELTKANSELTKTKSELTKASSDLTKTKSELTKASSELTKANSELTKASSELTKANSELTKANSELARQQELNALLERDQQVAANTISELKRAELALQQSLDERFNELAILTNMLHQQEQQHEAVLSELQAMQAQLKTQAEQTEPPQPQGIKITAKLINPFKAVKQRRLQAKQFAEDVKAIRDSNMFDEAWYLAQHPEAANHQHGAAGHYLEHGVALGINPSARFDGNWYLNTHQDVKEAGMNPLFHYLKFGHKESRLLKNF